MTVLVTAASKHGATLEIAETLARVLEESGIEAEFIELDEVGDLGNYDAYVVGSGIYLGNWLKQARRFIDAHAAELAASDLVVRQRPHRRRAACRRRPERAASRACRAPGRDDPCASSGGGSRGAGR